MKQALSRIVRAITPGLLLRCIETSYRVLRVHFISFCYGYPARHLTVIGVTGTNGKTTTVNYINEIFKAAGKRTAMFSTATIEIGGQQQRNDLNATVGTTKRMQQFFRQAKRAEVDYVVMEFPSHALDQHKLDMVPVDTAIMTNLTQDHLDYHKTMEAYARAKAKLFKKHPRVIVLNKDDKWFDYYKQFSANEIRYDYSLNDSSDVYVSKPKYFSRSTQAILCLPSGEKHQVELNLPGKFNVSNMLAAAACAYGAGIDATVIAQGVARLKAIPGRFELVPNNKSFTIIVDYAHTPDGLEQFLSSVSETAEGRIHLVFGSCGDRDKAKRPIMGEIAARYCDELYVTDEESYSEDPATIRHDVIAGVKGRSVQEIPDRRRAIKQALLAAQPNDVVLVTGLGHEVYRIMGDQKLAWNDTEEIRKILDEI